MRVQLPWPQQDNMHLLSVMSRIQTEITDSLASNRINETIGQSAIINRPSLRTSFFFLFVSEEKTEKTTINRANRLYR